VFRVLIVDDKKSSRKSIKVLLSSEIDISEIYEAEDGNNAVKMAKMLKPDLVFLDIEIPGISGIEVAKQLPEQSMVVFATSSNEFAVNIFETNAIDYLLRPFDDERFYQALEKARRRVHKYKMGHFATNGQQKKFRDKLGIRDPGRIRLIDVGQINYIGGAGNYAEIHLDDGKQFLHRETLSVLESQLDPTIFVRLNRSSIVRRSSIIEIRTNETGDYSVALMSGTVLKLSRRNRSMFHDLTN
jgi:two-component system LytT family response regulator